MLFYTMEDPTLYVTYLGAAHTHSSDLIFTFNEVNGVYSDTFSIAELQKIVDGKHTAGQELILDIMYHALCCQNIYDEDLLLMWHGHLFRVKSEPIHLLSTPNSRPILLERISTFINELHKKQLSDLSKCDTKHRYNKTTDWLGYISKFDRISLHGSLLNAYNFALRSHEIRNFIVAWGCNELPPLWGQEDLLEPNLLRLVMQFMR